LLCNKHNVSNLIHRSLEGVERITFLRLCSPIFFEKYAVLVLCIKDLLVT